MIVVGKTHMVEFAFGGWGTNARMGTPWNPWDLTTHRVPGGSSSGSGVAVAAGMVPAALGSDTGGSVRIPASVCGLVGLKTTAGRVSNHGILPLSPTLDTIGPLVRAVEDAALLYDVLHGPDGADPATWPHAPALAMPRLREPVRGLRVGLPGSPHLDGLDADVARHFQAAVEALGGLGVHVETIPLPGSFFSYLEQTGTIISAEAYDLLGDVVEDEAAPLDPHVRARILGGRAFNRDAQGAHGYLSALRERRQAQAALAPIFDQVDAILTPTTPIPAPPLSDVDESRLPLSRFTRAINFLGLCALAVPMGVTEAGLPTSLQIIGRPFCEPLLLRLGWAYEQARGPLGAQPDVTAMG
jgi:aspartyl-tRNA(Asn)/glutamyl-tRNA(Gln) amidotransferase subunit A